MQTPHSGWRETTLAGLRQGDRTMHRLLALGTAIFALLMLGTPNAAQDPHRWGAIFVQCPGDTNGDSIPEGPADVDGDGVPDLVRCMHLAAGDGMVTMADGHKLYTFGFSDVTGVLPQNVMTTGALAANFPAPTIRAREGEHFYLNLTNAGMLLWPDLFDAHSVHFHGFPQAAAVFDGVPESSTTVHMGSSFTYYYKIMEPGTYMYHCHVEATEHMQMGMLGNLYIEPKQNRTGCPGGACPVARLEGGPASAPLGYAYNDGDGSTAYDVEYPIQLGSFDPNFHDLHLAIQPLPFAAMRDTYPMLNGRGYPDTINPGVLTTDTDLGPRASQKINSLIEAAPGKRILLRGAAHQPPRRAGILIRRWPHSRSSRGKSPRWTTAGSVPPA